MPRLAMPRRLPSRFVVTTVIAVLAVALGLGVGLPGIVRAFTASSGHVCTCTTGGTHATCPFCNPSLRRPSRDRAKSVDGLPCGTGRVAVGGCDWAVVPEVGASQKAPFVRVLAAGARPRAPHDDQAQPPTPPPRPLPA